LGNSFTLTTNIDFRKLEAIAGDEEILIGYPEGLQHTPSFEGPAVDMADLARKLSFGAGPQTWKTNRGGVVREHYVQGIPARPFLEDGIENGADEINGRIEKAQSIGTSCYRGHCYWRDSEMGPGHKQLPAKLSDHD
jgi:hypothetical protein